MLTNPARAVQGEGRSIAIEARQFVSQLRVALEFSEFAAMIAALYIGTGTSMPIYEYQCQDCQHKLEVMQRMSEPRLTTCPTCGKESLKKLVSAVGFQLKGTGWYETDFKGKPKTPRGGDGESASSSSSSSSSSESTSSDTKTKTSTASADD
jgi:putative FmdB family regulatory protein